MGVDQSSHLLANIEQFSGFSDLYDSCRPKAPLFVVDLVRQLSGIERPDLVVDLGSGTGLSTMIWANAADQVIGIEPNDDMRAEAARRRDEAGSKYIRFISGLSNKTGLESESADVITVSQALHWMEPHSTFDEVARVLKPGGVFIAYDCDWPPCVHYECEEAWSSCFAQHPRRD